MCAEKGEVAWRKETCKSGDVCQQWDNVYGACMRIMYVSVYVLYKVQCVVILRDAANTNTDGSGKEDVVSFCIQVLLVGHVYHVHA